MIAATRPYYPDDRRIEMTAYIGPRRQGKRYYNGVYGANPRDLKEGYPSFITDDVFELYKNAGFSFLMPEGDAFYQRKTTSDGIVRETDFEKSDLYQYMKMAQQHGLAVYLSRDCSWQTSAGRRGKKVDPILCGDNRDLFSGGIQGHHVDG